MTTEKPKKADKENSVAALVLHHSVTVILVVAMLALGVWGYITFKKSDFFYAPTDSDSSTRRYLVASQLQRLELAASAYQELHTSPPLSLEALVEEGFLTPTDLTYPSPTITYALQIDGSKLKVTYVTELGAGEAEAPSPEVEEEEKEAETIDPAE